MFCHNNYIKYGWGNQLYGTRQSDDDKFWMKFGSCTQEPLDFKSECIRAARLLYEGTEKKILVHFSGGIDSEIICRSFLEAKVPFEVCIWKYEANLNDHDIKYAVKFCKEYNIKYSFFEISLIESILQYKKYYNDRYHVPFYSINIRKKAIEASDGYQIIGDGHILFIYDPYSKELPIQNKYLYPISLLIKYSIGEKNEYAKPYAIITEQKHANHISFIREIGKDGTNNFFYYTPELLLSFLTDSLVNEWFEYCDLKNLKDDRKYPIMRNNPRYHDWVSGNEYIKNINTSGLCNLRQHIKYKHWPELEVRPKYTGADLFESMLMKRHVEKISKEFPFGKPGNEIIFRDVWEFKTELDQHKMGSAESYKGYDKYCSITRGKSIKEMFGKGTFYEERNSIIVDMLDDNSSIFEFAATYGFLANQISKKVNFKKYTTSNFLPDVVEYMRHQIKNKNINIIELDANNIENIGEYDTFICTSFEHLEHDIDIIKKLHGTFIFSVPNFDDPTHFRTFQSEQEIINRYEKFININEIKTIQKEHMKKFIVKGTI